MRARPSTVVVCAFTGLALAACGSSSQMSPMSPSGNMQQLSQQMTTAHFTFHYSQGDSVDSSWQEAYHAWMISQMGVTPPMITYDKYRDRSQMGMMTGHGNTNGYADPGAATIHTIWPTDNHETVHICVAAWGSPVAMFSEGIAVAHQMNPPAGDFVAKWSGTPIHDLARRFRAQGQLIPLSMMAETAAFRSRDDNITYPECGSFVRYMIDTYGMAMMRQLYGSMPNDANLAAVRAAFQRVYGFSLDEAETRWQRFLDGA